MSTQWGQDPYGQEQDRYGQEQAPYAAQQSPYGVGVPGPYGAPIAMAPPSSGLGIAGFVLGLLSITACTGITGPFGLVLSIMGMRETSPAAASPRSGRGLAIAGLVLSILGTLLLLAFVAYVIFMVVVVGLSASSGS